MGRIVVRIVALWALTLVGRASATTVAIVRAEDPSPIIAEALVRLEGELTSVGFETAILDVPRETEGSSGAPAVRLDQIASRWRVDAAVSVFSDPASGRVAVWVVDRATGRALGREATVEGGLQRSSRTLAIRALELLRSTFLELDLSLPQPPLREPAAPPAIPGVRVAAASGSADVARRWRVGLEVGGAVVATTGGVGAAVLPLLRIDWAPRPEWAAAVSAAGLGTRPTVRSGAASAEVGREAVLLGVSRRFRAGRRVRPLVSFAAGALHTTADGSAEAPNQGHHATRWSLLLEAALGADLRLDDRFFLVGAAHAQLAEPYPAVRLLDQDAATVGRPDLLLTLSVGAWL